MFQWEAKLLPWTENTAPVSLLEWMDPYVQIVREKASALSSGEAEFGDPEEELIGDEDEERWPVVSFTIVLPRATRKKARAFRKLLYDQIAEELPPSALERLAVFVNYRAE